MPPDENLITLSAIAPRLAETCPPKELLEMLDREPRKTVYSQHFVRSLASRMLRAETEQGIQVLSAGVDAMGAPVYPLDFVQYLTGRIEDLKNAPSAPPQVTRLDLTKGAKVLLADVEQNGNGALYGDQDVYALLRSAASKDEAIQDLRTAIKKLKKHADNADLAIRALRGSDVAPAVGDYTNEQLRAADPRSGGGKL